MSVHIGDYVGRSNVRLRQVRSIGRHPGGSRSIVCLEGKGSVYLKNDRIFLPIARFVEGGYTKLALFFIYLPYLTPVIAGARYLKTPRGSQATRPLLHIYTLPPHCTIMTIDEKAKGYIRKRQRSAFRSRRNISNARQRTGC